MEDNLEATINKVDSPKIKKVAKEKKEKERKENEERAPR